VGEIWQFSDLKSLSGAVRMADLHEYNEGEDPAGYALRW